MANLSLIGKRVRNMDNSDKTNAAKEQKKSLTAATCYLVDVKHCCLGRFSMFYTKFS